MSSSLLSNRSSREQQRANVLTDRPNRIKVIVEDEADVVIWKRLLDKYAPGYKFYVSPFDSRECYAGKGKGHIMEMSRANVFGPYYIGCVDSDYDWLLKQWSNDGAEIDRNPYVLQTYAHTLENLASQPYGVQDCILECYMHICDLLHRADDDYKTFILTLSDMLYEILLWHLIIRKNHADSPEISYGLQYIFKKEIYEKLPNSLSIEERREEVLNILFKRTGEQIKVYENKFANLINDRKALEQLLISQYNLTRFNAYLHFDGHGLMDFIHRVYFNPLIEFIKKDHKKDIIEHSQGQESNKQSETGRLISHYFNLEKNFENKFLHRAAYLNDDSNPVNQLIRKDIQAVFTLPTV